MRSRWIQPDWRKWELGGRLDPTTGALVEGGIEAQTRQVFANLDAVLAATGSSFADVVKVNVFLTDMADFSTVNTIYATIFSEPHPGPHHHRGCWTTPGRSTRGRARRPRTLTSTPGNPRTVRSRRRRSLPLSGSIDVHQQALQMRYYECIVTHRLGVSAA